MDREISDQVKENDFHPTLKRQLSEGVKAFHIEDLESAIEGTDLIIGGVSSFGVDWFIEKVLPHIPDTVPVLSVTKGLQDESDGRLITFPHLMQNNLPSERNLSLNAIGGPCTSYELADRRDSAVVFCGEHPKIFRKLKDMLETSYYHISLSTDIVGVECAVAVN